MTNETNPILTAARERKSESVTHAETHRLLARISEELNRMGMHTIYSPEHEDVDIEMLGGRVYRVKLTRVN